MKKLALATVAAGALMWVVAGLWHGLVAAAFYAERTEADHEGTGIILVAYLVLAALMAYLYPRATPGRRPALTGLKFGAIMGLLWVFPHELAMAGAHGEPLDYVVKNAAWHMVEQGLGGIVIALVYGRTAAPT